MRSPPLVVNDVRLLGLVLEVGDQVVPVLGLLETAESHLGARDILLWVLEVLKLRQGQYASLPAPLCHLWTTYQSVLLPQNALLLIRIGV